MHRRLLDGGWLRRRRGSWWFGPHCPEPQPATSGRCNSERGEEESQQRSSGGDRADLHSGGVAFERRRVCDKLRHAALAAKLKACRAVCPGGADAAGPRWAGPLCRPAAVAGVRRRRREAVRLPRRIAGGERVAVGVPLAWGGPGRVSGAELELELPPGEATAEAVLRETW